VPAIQRHAYRTLAERYEHTLARLERIRQAGYRVKIQWECEFEFPENIEMTENTPLRTRDAPYGGRTDPIRLHNKEKEWKKL
jgi:G:T-mismatch repair DNA endonuclease (very short patch repair protein)